MTAGSADLSRPSMMPCTSPHTNHHQGEGSAAPTTPPQPHPVAADSASQRPLPAAVKEPTVEEKRESSQEPQQGTSRLPQRGTSQESSDSQMQDRVSSRSRSVTPTPAISIEPDVGLEWTADMLSLKESEVVTSDTSLAKARGSNTTTTSSVVYPSDDDSLDGDGVFGEDTPDEGGEGEGEGPSEPDHTSNQPVEEVDRGASGADSDNVSNCHFCGLERRWGIPMWLCLHRVGYPGEHHGEKPGYRGGDPPECSRGAYTTGTWVESTLRTPPTQNQRNS